MIQYAVSNNIILDIFSCSSAPENTTLQNQAENSIYRVHTMKNMKVWLFCEHIIPNTYGSKLINELQDKKIPVVLIASKNQGISSVGIDNFSAMKKLVEHLIHEHNYTKINYIGRDMYNKEARERHAGYIEALAENDQNLNHDKMYLGELDLSKIEETVNRFFEEGREKPEAIVCGDDVIAMRVCDILNHKKIKVPEEVAVTGFN
jgi:DNA-binding LacI/PurR family transcriptional regulator